METPRLPVRRAHSPPRFTRRHRESCWATPANLFVRTPCERRRTWRRRLSSSRTEPCPGAARRKRSASETVFRVQYSDIQSNHFPLSFQILSNDSQKVLLIATFYTTNFEWQPVSYLFMLFRRSVFVCCLEVWYDSEDKSLMILLMERLDRTPTSIIFLDFPSSTE